MWMNVLEKLLRLLSLAPLLCHRPCFIFCIHCHVDSGDSMQMSWCSTYSSIQQGSSNLISCVLRWVSDLVTDTGKRTEICLRVRNLVISQDTSVHSEAVWAVICKHQMAKICVLCNIAHYDNMIYIMYDILWILCKINLPLPHSTERGGPSMQCNIYHIHLTIMIML